MKDKDFEGLLKNSVQAYGHDYIDLPEQPVTPHRFPDDFISDIPLNPKPKKSPTRYVRIIAATAAVLVLAAAIFTIPALFNRSSHIADNVTAPNGAIAEEADQSNHFPSKNSSSHIIPEQNKTENDITSPSEVSQNAIVIDRETSNAEYDSAQETSLVPSQTPSEYSSPDDTATHQASFGDYEIPPEVSLDNHEASYRESSIKSDSSTGKGYQEDSNGPETSAYALLNYQGEDYALTYDTTQELFVQISRCMLPELRQTSLPSPTQSTKIITLEPDDCESLVISNTEYKFMEICINSDHLAVIAASDNRIDCFRIGSNKPQYKLLVEKLKNLLPL